MADTGAEGGSLGRSRSGKPLKWLPRSTSSQQTSSEVVPTAYNESGSAPRPLRTAQNQSSRPLSGAAGDPFGDAERAMPTPAKRPSDELAPQLPLEPIPRESMRESGSDAQQESPAPEQPYTTSEPVAPEIAPGVIPGPAENILSQPSSEHQFAPRQHRLEEQCPSPKDLKPIAELTTNITPSEGELPHDCPLGNDTFVPRSFAPVTFHWTASALCHKPLYFEDVQLERYGHMAGPWVQPFASFANFFATFPILPYKMGLETPNECMYSLGYYRPGECAPYLFDPIPLSVRGAMFEAGAWVGGCYAFP